METLNTGDIVNIKPELESEFESLLSEKDKREYSVLKDIYISRVYGNKKYFRVGFHGDEYLLNLQYIANIEKAFKSLNDVPIEGFQRGKTEIWYLKSWGRSDEHHPWERTNDFFMADFFENGKRNVVLPKSLSQYHVLIGKIKITDLNQIFLLLQGDNWCMGRRCNNLIRKLNTHTSISIGDIIVIGTKGYIAVDSDMNHPKVTDGFYEFDLTEMK